MSWKKILSLATIILAAFLIGAYILLSTYDYNSLKPRIADAVKDATGRELVLGEKINLKLGLSPALVLGHIAFQNAPWGSRPDMVTVKRLEIQVALLPLILGHIDVKRFVLIQPDILIETDRSGRSNLSFELKEKPASSSTKTMPPAGRHLELPALNVAEVEIERGYVTYRDGKTGKSYAVQINRLAAIAGSAGSPINLKLMSVYNGRPLVIAGTIGPWAAITSQEDCSLDLTGTFGEIQAAVKGIIKDVPNLRHVDLDIQAKAKDLADLKTFVGEPLSSQGPFETALRITDPSYHVYRLSELKVGLGPSKLSGSVEADLSKDRPTLSAVLASKMVDLRPLLAERRAKLPRAGTKEAQATNQGKVFSKTPLPLEALGRADVMIKARVDKILLPDVAIDALTAEIALKGGELKIDPLKGTVGGGSLGASLDLEPEGATALIKTELKVEQLDLGRMMKELGRGGSLEGLLNVHVDADGKGVSEADMMSKLNGRVILTMHQGKIENRFIHLLGGELSSNLFLLLNPFRKQVDYTAVECLVSGFNIGHGIATTTALVVVTDEMAIIGEGDVNLGTEELDLPLKLVPKGAIAGIPSELGFNIAEVTKPFKLAGTLAHPSLAIDTTRAGETIAKAIGGIALFGPAGIAAALVTGSPGDGDLCRVAAEAAQKGLKLSVVEEKNKGKGVAGEAVQGLEKGLGEIGKGLEGLFGK